MTKLLYYVNFASLVFTIDCHNILGIFPSRDRTHYVLYRDLFRELAERNHEITLISHYQLPNPPKNYKEVLLSEASPKKGLSFESVISDDVSRLPFETLHLTKTGNDDCKMLMANNFVTHMIRVRPIYDVVIAESFNSDCALALAANLSAPYIALIPKPNQPWHFNRLGISFNSATVAQSGLSYGKNPWFFERLKSFILYHAVDWIYYVCSQVTDRVFLYKYLGDDLSTLEDIAANASLYLLNSHPSVFGGVSRADNVIDIGGIHLREPKEIPPQIDKFITGADFGVVYVNLGLTVKDSTLSANKVQELISAFRELPQRVLWKWEGQEIADLPQNVMVVRWLPQFDVLNHENVKVFVTHGGTLGVMEAVKTGVPVVAVPLFGDHWGNSAALKDLDIAEIVHYEELSKTRLIDAINDMMDKRVQEKAREISNLWTDRPLSPMETAVYWIEYVARHGGAPNLNSLQSRAPFYLQNQLDVIIFIVLVLFVLFWVTYKILCSIFCCCESDRSEVKNGKRVKFE